MSDPFGADNADFDYNTTFGVADPAQQQAAPIAVNPPRESFGLDDADYQQIDATSYSFDPTGTSAGFQAPLPDPIPESFQQPPPLPSQSSLPPLPQAAAPASAEPQFSGPDALAEFLSKWEKVLEQKNVQHDQVGTKAREGAKSDLAKFHTERELLKDSKQAKNRQEEQALLERLESELENENPWARVLNLVDVDAKAKKEENKSDLARMRSIFIQLKNEPIKARS